MPHHFDPQYKDCPHCGDQMSLTRGRYYCRNISGCAYVEPMQADDAASPEYLSLLRARRRAARRSRRSY